MAKPTVLRTRVYVDGYNFYYGCLKRTEYKWLDLKILVDLILSTIHHDVGGSAAQFELQSPAIKYFTAPILKNFARAEDSVKCQSDYHTALRHHLGESIAIIGGYYDAKPARAYKHEEGKAASACDIIDIWKLEEKQSDVSLALHAYSDALRGMVDHVVFITNDTDLVPAMQAIREHTEVTIGLIVPTKEKERRANTSLTDLSHWTRDSIRFGELEKAQLPTPIRISTKKVIQKPISWYPRPDLLVPIFEEVKRVKKSAGAAWKWLNTENDYFDGRRPVDMIKNEEEAKDLWAYMNQYAKDFNI